MTFYIMYYFYFCGLYCRIFTKPYIFSVISSNYYSASITFFFLEKKRFCNIFYKIYIFIIEEKGFREFSSKKILFFVFFFFPTRPNLKTNNTLKNAPILEYLKIQNLKRFLFEEISDEQKENNPLWFDILKI